MPSGNPPDNVGFFDDGYYNGAWHWDPSHQHRDLRHFCQMLKQWCTSPPLPADLLADIDRLDSSLMPANMITNPTGQATILYASNFTRPCWVVKDNSGKDVIYNNLWGFSTLLNGDAGGGTHYGEQYKKLKIYQDCPELWNLIAQLHP